MDTSGNNDDQGDLMDTSGDINFDLDDGPSSLLPGLEDFAKSGDGDNTGPGDMDIDFSMADLPDVSTDAKPPVEQPAPAKPAEQPPAPQPAPAQDVKDEKPEEASKDNGDLMATMATTDDLEDLFNMDEYENPESTSFDDAFFNFE
jgi:hypothetical protein